jgi:hypothetical protein
MYNNTMTSGSLQLIKNLPSFDHVIVILACKFDKTVVPIQPLVSILPLHSPQNRMMAWSCFTRVHGTPISTLSDSMGQPENISIS